MKDLISSFVLTLLNFLRKLVLYIFMIYQTIWSKSSKYKIYVLKVKHPLRLRNVFPGQKKFVVFDTNSLEHVNSLLRRTWSWQTDLIISNIRWKIIFPKNLETWNKISFLIDAVYLEWTWTVIFSINLKLAFLLFIMLCFMLIFQIASI